MPGTYTPCAPQLDVDLAGAASCAAVDFPTIVTITAHIGHDGIAPSGVRQTYTVDGKVFGGKAYYNAHDLARSLIADGHDPDDTLQTVTAGGTPSMRGRLGEWAKWSLTEGANGFSVRKWRPFPSAEMLFPARR